MDQFHFQRPEWLLAFIPLCILAWLLIQRKLFSRSWQSVIDPQLLPHLLIGKPGKASRWPIFLFIITGILAILAVAGPAWEKLPQPVFKEQSALVILLDLSRSMDAADLKPTRLTRARHKISDILHNRKTGQTALIGYAAEAFTVSPLTDDAATIDSLIPSLTTDIMPAQGSRVDRALEKAAELMKNAGISKGDILVITDGIQKKSMEAFENIRDHGHRISILAVGTSDGGPISLADGGFLKDQGGSIVIPKLDSAGLRSIAMQSSGRFSEITPDDTDIKHLLALLEINRLKAESEQTEMKADVWQEEGPWLLLAIMPLAALAFRRGYIAMLLLSLLLMPDSAQALSWDELWSNKDQRAAKAMEAGKPKQAATLFNNKEWKATAHYKAGQYEEALEELSDIDHPEAHYNRGNTLAKLGRLPEAVDAYQKTLDHNPNHQDAQANKELLEKIMEEQEKQQQKNQDKNQDQSGENQQQDQQDQQQKENQDQQQNQSKEQQGEGQENQQAQDTEQQQSSQNEEQQPADEKNAEQKQAEQTQHKDQSDTQNDNQQAMPMDQEHQLSEQAKEQWLRRIPDDPGGLMRRKFRYQYQNKKNRRNEAQAW